MPERQHVYVEAETKTKNSRRSVIITPFALEALKEHRVRQLEAKLKTGASWQEHDYVFCTLHGTHLGPNHVVEEFNLLLKQAELPDIRFHDLRHSAATLLLSLGIHPKVVQELLGHTQISITKDVYSHVLPGMQQDAMGELNEALMQLYSAVHPLVRLHLRLFLQSQKVACPFLHPHIPRHRSCRFARGHPE